MDRRRAWAAHWKTAISKCSTTANSRLKRAPNTSLWEAMQNEAREKAQHEPILGSYFHATILNHKSFQSR